MSKFALVIGGGDGISPREFAALRGQYTVVAADSGIDRAFDVGLAVDVAIGDFDSVSGQGYLRAENAGVEIIRHPTSKSETDLELALLHALTLQPDRIVVASIGGGRPDHFLAGILLLADERFAGVEMDALVDDHRLSVIHHRRVLTGSVGSLLTLLPIGGPAVGAATIGLAYPLDDETLAANSPRGMSNTFLSPLAIVSLENGVLFALQELPG